MLNVDLQNRYNRLRDLHARLFNDPNFIGFFPNNKFVTSDQFGVALELSEDFRVLTNEKTNRFLIEYNVRNRGFAEWRRIGVYTFALAIDVITGLCSPENEQSFQGSFDLFQTPSAFEIQYIQKLSHAN